MELIAPHRWNRREPEMQDVRKMKLRDRKFFTQYYLVATSLLLVIAILMPAHNWDMLMYAGIALKISSDYDDIEAIQSAVYQEVRETVSPDKYETLTGGSYRQIVSTDPEAFEQQLPFYQSRILYIGLVYLLAEIGLALLPATHLVSAVAVFVGLWLFHFTYHTFIDVRLLYLLPLFWIATALLRVAQLSTTEGLTFLAIALCLFLLMRGNWLLLVLLPLLVLIKPVLLVFSVLMLIYLFVFSHSWRIPILFAALASAALYYLAARYFGTYSWVALMNFVFLERVAYPAEAIVAWTAVEHLRVLHAGSRTLFQGPLALYAAVVAALSSAYWLAYGRSCITSDRKNQLVHVTIILLLYALLHFIAYPAADDRFFVGPYYTAALALLFILTDGYPQLVGSKTVTASSSA